ncbi:hypothetical protein [Shimia sp.]|uniref:hypothetical protein n=1 Tax=Shimia sp. TaxID=1954381 RepID=UPI003B8AFBBF
MSKKIKLTARHTMAERGIKKGETFDVQSEEEARGLIRDGWVVDPKAKEAAAAEKSEKAK